jgi:hypothetical protein
MTRVLSNDQQDVDVELDEELTEEEEGARLGPLLDEPDEEKVVKKVKRLRERQEKAMQRRRAVWKRNELWRDGIRWVRLDRSEDVWEARVPYGMENAPPTPNKTDRLCRRVTATLLVDEPVPEAEPSTDSPEDLDSAEFGTRALKIEGSEAGLNFRGMMEEGIDKAHTFASSFSYFTLDPTGGGSQPKRIRAHKAAVLADGRGSELVNPQTGQPGTDPDYIDRFVAADGKITDAESEAERQWLPAIRRKVLTGKQVLFLPANAASIADALGVHITDYCTLGELKARFEKAFAKLHEDQLRKIADWEPDGADEIYPEHLRDYPRQESERGVPKDDQLVWYECVYYKSHADYPEGAYVCVAGESSLLHREVWSRDIETPEGQKKEYLELPVSQCRCLNDYTHDDPYGIGLVERLGPADEVRASVLGYQLEYLYRFGNPNVYLPIGSIVQPKQLITRTGDPIYVNPQGKPEYENTPEFPKIGTELRTSMGDEMNDETMLQQAAQGVEGKNVDSGIHAQTIVEQALVGLSQVRANAADYYKRSCRIVLQLMRVFYTTERRLKYVGEDGRYKERSWTGADLRTTRDVSIARGSFTMYTPSAKRQMALAELGKTIDPDEYERLSSNQMSPILGTQDNPFRMKVRRELDDWTQGPDAGFEQAVQAREQAIAQAQELAQSGAADPSAIAAAIPPLPSPVKRVPADLEIRVATIRHSEIIRFMSSGKYERFADNPKWQEVLLAEYNAMKQAAGILTVQDQQRIAAESAKAQQAQEAQKDEKTRQHEREKQDKDIQSREAADQRKAAVAAV